MKQIVSICMFLLVVSCAHNNDQKNITAEDRLKNFSQTQFVYVPESTVSKFNPDNVQSTLQIVTISAGESYVSEDGQVIYLRKEDTNAFKALLDEAMNKRIILN